MARIAIVQRYAYDSSSNGDASYINEIMKHLERKGHEIFLFTTKMTEGRTKPFFRSSFGKVQHDVVRHALVIDGMKISYRPGAWVRPILRLAGRSANEHQAKDRVELASEAKWLHGQAAANRIDKLILVYNGILLAEHLDATAMEYAAIPVLFYANASSLTGKGAASDASALMAEEVRHLKEAPLVGFHSNDDAIEARKIGVRNAVKVGIGVSIKKKGDYARRPDSDTVLFVAALANQNIESLDWFLAEVWPLVLQTVPAAKLRVAGSIGRMLADRDVGGHVEALGFVDDLGTEYGRAAVVIAPLVTGSKGMKVKVAEALAYACPLVATSISLDSGDRAWADEAMRLADTPHEFAAAVIAVLRSTDEQHRLSRMAAAAYDDHIQPSAAYRALDAYIDG